MKKNIQNLLLKKDDSENEQRAETPGNKTSKKKQAQPVKRVRFQKPEKNNLNETPKNISLVRRQLSPRLPSALKAFKDLQENNSYKKNDNMIIEQANNGNSDKAKHQKAKNLCRKGSEYQDSSVLFCDMQCKGERGLKIHLNARKRHSSYDASEVEKENKEGMDLSQFVTNSNIDNSYNNNCDPLVITRHSNNRIANYTQDALTPSCSYNISELQNNSTIGNNYNNALNFGSSIQNFANSANQLNASSLQFVPNQIIQLPDSIPRFDYNSDEYAEWLEEFVSNCKMHNYPLNPDLCRKMSLVSNKLLGALVMPPFSAEQKEKHIYFYNLYSNLSEMMLKHLQHKLSGRN